MSPNPSARPFFMGAGAQRRLALFHPAHAAEPRAVVLYLHPLAEEMNKARRMAALQSRALAAAGCAVLQIDLLGCGDSAGEFTDASWQAWIDDALAATQWLRQQHATAPLWLWGLRAGCLLAAETARQLDEPCNLLWWQAPASGRLVLQQFLRLRLAAELGDGNAGALMKALRQQLAEGQAIEVAGYGLSPALAAGLEAATLVPPSRAARLAWLDVVGNVEAPVAPVTLNALAQWRQAGWHVSHARVAGPVFWQTAEIETCSALLQATLQDLAETTVAA